MGKGENIIYLTGELIEPFKLDHSVKGEDFYAATVKVERHSGEQDLIPVVVSSKMLNGNVGEKGWCVSVIGQVRKTSSTKVLANNRIDVWSDAYFNENDVSLVGSVQKVYYRKTPKGKQITELILAVDRGYGVKDYIPCITWSENANMAKDLATGEVVTVKGRLQSRNYVKAKETTPRTTYEVSVSVIFKVKEIENGDKGIKSGN